MYAPSLAAPQEASPWLTLSSPFFFAAQRCALPPRSRLGSMETLQGARLVCVQKGQLVLLGRALRCDVDTNRSASVVEQVSASIELRKLYQHFLLFQTLAFVSCTSSIERRDICDLPDLPLADGSSRFTLRSSPPTCFLSRPSSCQSLLLALFF